MDVWVGKDADSSHIPLAQTARENGRESGAFFARESVFEEGTAKLRQGT